MHCNPRISSYAEQSFDQSSKNNQVLELGVGRRIFIGSGEEFTKGGCQKLSCIPKTSKNFALSGEGFRRLWQIWARDQHKVAEAQTGLDICMRQQWLEKTTVHIGKSQHMNKPDTNDPAAIQKLVRL